MSKKENKLNMKRLLIIIAVIILILIIVLSILLRKPTSLELALEKLEYINSTDVEQWEDGTIYPENSAALGRAYQGNLSIMSIGKSTYYIATEVFPKYYSKLKGASKDKIEKYFQNESETIYTDLAIKDKDVFVKLIR